MCGFVWWGCGGMSGWVGWLVGGWVGGCGTQHVFQACDRSARRPPSFCPPPQPIPRLGRPSLSLTPSSLTPLSSTLLTCPTPSPAPNSTPTPPPSRTLVTTSLLCYRTWLRLHFSNNHECNPPPHHPHPHTPRPPPAATWLRVRRRCSRCSRPWSGLRRQLPSWETR